MSATDQVAAGPRGAIQGRRPVMIGAVVVLLLLTALLVYHWGSAGPSGALPATTPSASPSASKQPTTADIYTAVAPSVVEITATLAEGGGDLTGTGVIVNADGTILTALHVVKGAGAIQVTFADGTYLPGDGDGGRPDQDIATLGPATLPSILVPAVLGSPGRLAVGQNVVAIGNPLGLTRTTTTGVVSGLSRAAREPDGTNLSGLIQFDAAVNPGSSGGPLLNAQGQTVGIVVALANPTAAGTFIGIGFAVPITAAVGAGGGDRVPQQ